MNYPTTSQLAAFRRAIPCATDHADRWFDCPFSRTHVTDHEREHGIGYVITHGSGADVDLAPIWSSDWRRKAGAMRRRAASADYGDAGASAITTFVPHTHAAYDPPDPRMGECKVCGIRGWHWMAADA